MIIIIDRFTLIIIYFAGYMNNNRLPGYLKFLFAVFAASLAAFYVVDGVFTWTCDADPWSCDEYPWFSFVTMFVA